MADELQKIFGPARPPPPGFDAENAQNLEDMEKQFAVKTVQHAEIYWSLLGKIRGSQLRLTKMDKEILEHLQADFPELNEEIHNGINEDKMKSKEGKVRWRKFMMKYEKLIDDYNMGTLLRTHHKDEYEEKTTIIVPRMQFYAYEILRNHLKLNDWIYEENHPEEKKE